MVTFAEIRARAEERHGVDGLARRLPTPRTPAELRALPDDRYLASMAQRVFSAGFVWRVIEAKWPGFEEAFHRFDPATVADLGAEAIEALMADARVVRNRQKILSTVGNARFVVDVAREHGSFGAYLAAWPATDTLGLWRDLQGRGDRLGGDTAAWFLRDVGKDTFRFSRDVIGALVDAGVVRKPAKEGVLGKRDQDAAQAAFNAYAAESGLPLCQISVILSCSTGALYA